MAGKVPARNKPVIDTIARFPNLGNLTIAKIVLSQHGDLYENNIERVRSIVRQYRGANGQTSAHKRINGVPTTPVTMPRTWRQERTPYKLSSGLWLVLPDVHVPYHEPKPIEAAIEYGRKNKVNGVIFLGDLQDCASIGFWPITRQRNFDKEVLMLIDFLRFIKSEFPKAKMVYKKGNHEYRLPRMYYQKAPELADIHFSAMDVVLDLESRGIDTVDYFQIIKAGKLPLLHGHEIKISSAVNPARGLFLKTSTFAACAHFHQTSMHPGKNLNGDMLTTWSFGCLCDLHPDYNPYGAWNWGFALINVEKDGNFEVDNRRVLESGKVV